MAPGQRRRNPAHRNGCGSRRTADHARIFQPSDATVIPFMILSALPDQECSRLVEQYICKGTANALNKTSHVGQVLLISDSIVYDELPTRVLQLTRDELSSQDKQEAKVRH